MALEVGQLVAILALKDLLTPALKDAGNAVDSFDKKFGTSMGTLGKAAGGAVAILGGIGAAIIELGTRGSDVADVQAHFDALNKGIGNTGDVLGVLGSALGGTVSDFDIMKSANLAMSQGLVLTTDQFRLTGQAARVLADTVHTDNLTAFNALNEAMATGRDKGLKMIGVHIDLKGAVEKYAASIGKTSDNLSEAQILEANRNAILAEMKRRLDEGGLSQTDFSDRMAQGKVAVQNFTDSLAVAIANNPALSAGMGVVADSIASAFGPEKAGMVQTLSGYVASFAIFMTHVADVGIYAARVIGEGWNGLNAVFNAIMSGLADALGLVVGGMAAAADAGVKTGLVSKETAAQTHALADGLKSFAEQSQKATEDALKSQDSFNQKMDAASSVVARVRTAMEGAKNSQVQLDVATQHATTTNQMSEKELLAIAKAHEKWTLTMYEAIKAQQKQNEDTMTAMTTNVINKMMEDRKDRIDAAATAYDGMLHAQIEADQHAEAAAEAAEIAENARFDRRIAGLKEIGQLIGGSFGGLVSQGAGALDSFATAMSQAETADDVFRAKTELAAAAAGMLGGMLEKSTNPTVAKLGGALQGAAAGAKAGAAFGPYGAAIGAVGGAIMGFINKAKQMAAAMKKMKDDFIASEGGMTALKRQCEEAGLSLDKAMAPKNIEQLKKNLDILKGQLDFVKESGGMDALRLHADMAGVSLKAIWEAKDKDTLMAAIDEAKAKLDTWDQAQKDLNAAVEKYGFTIAELGPKFAQQKLDQQAADLLKDYKLLTAAGVDHNAIISKMGPAFRDYVDSAIASGVSIPKAMKPQIDEMFKAGTLIHENGQAFTQAEVDGLSYTETMSEQFSSLLDSIQKLVDALLGIPSSVNTTITTTHRDTYQGDGGGDGDGRDDGRDYGYDYHAASGFNGMVFGPTRILAGEAGPEHVKITPGGSSSDGDLLGEMQGIRRDLQGLPYMLAKAAKHAAQT